MMNTTEIMNKLGNPQPYMCFEEEDWSATEMSAYYRRLRSDRLELALAQEPVTDEQLVFSALVVATETGVENV